MKGGKYMLVSIYSIHSKISIKKNSGNENRYLKIDF